MAGLAEWSVRARKSECRQIAELSKIDGLKVISRTSVFSFKSKEIDLREVRRKLDVASVLEGSVRRSGDRVRVDVRLVSIEDGRVLWTSHADDRVLTDILAVQDEIACRVAAGLHIRLRGETGPSLAKQHSHNVEAYQAYLKGLYSLNQETSEGIKKASEHFEQAVALDPNYALAWTGLASGARVFARPAQHRAALGRAAFRPQVC
jgi:hypothetical protein